MNILIIEDFYIKADYIIRHLQENDTYKWVKSYDSALIELENNEYECIFLDMMFPENDHSNPKSNMGFLMLEELENRQIKTPVVIFSSDSYNIKKDNVITCIKFNPNNNLTPKIEEIKLIINSNITKH